MRYCHRLLCLLALLSVTAVRAEAVLTEVDLPQDRPSLQRGAVTVTSVCMACHGLKYLRYRDLGELGFSPAELEAMSMGGKMGDPLLAMTPAEDAQQSYGVIPPDLSLMAKARAGGPAYIYSFLTAYYVDEAGQVNNHIFPDTAMPDMLAWSGAAADQRGAIEAQAREAAAFLNWAADPRADERRRLGYYVMAYLLLLTLLLYLVKRRVWARLR